jgi:hypothetical protein
LTPKGNGERERERGGIVEGHACTGIHLENKMSENER